MKWLILVVVLVGLAAWQLAPTMRSINTIVKVSERLLSSHTEIVEQLEQDKQELSGKLQEITTEIKTISTENLALRSELKKLQSETAKLIQSIPPISDVVPTDLEMCLTELTTARRTAASWKEVAEHQQGQIRLLESKLSSKDIIIINQSKQIELQGLHIEKVHEVQSEILAEGKRRGMIGMAIGGAVALLAILL